MSGNSITSRSRRRVRLRSVIVIGQSMRRSVTRRSGLASTRTTYPGTADLYHTYCSAHPDYGVCAERDEAESDARMHELKKHSDPTEAPHV